MSRYRDITLRLLAVLAILGALVMLARATAISSPWFAVIAAFVLLGLLDLARPYLTLRLPSGLMRSRDWELRGTLMRRAGIVTFGRILRRTPLRLLNTKVYLAAAAGDSAAVRAQIDSAEAAHFWAGLCTVPYLVLAFVRGWWPSLVALLIFDVLVHVYPILHLRWVRIRLQQVQRTRLTPTHGQPAASARSVVKQCAN